MFYMSVKKTVVCKMKTFINEWQVMVQGKS